MSQAYSRMISMLNNQSTKSIRSSSYQGNKINTYTTKNLYTWNSKNMQYCIFYNFTHSTTIIIPFVASNLLDEYGKALILVRLGEVDGLCPLRTDGERGDYHVRLATGQFSNHPRPLGRTIDLGRANASKHVLVLITAECGFCGLQVQHTCANASSNL